MGCSCGPQPDPKPSPAAGGCGATGDVPSPQAWFGQMINNCYRYAVEAKKAGHPIVGILCEFTPRELILAAGAVPVCLCGGSAKTIPPAEEVLPANLCPLIKSTFGYHRLRSNPFLEMADLVVAETTCDGKKKMYELLAESRPMYVLELPHKADDADALEYWLCQLQKFRSFLQERFHVALDDAALRTAIEQMNRERGLRRRLAALMESACPPLAGRELLDFKSSISTVPADLHQYEAALQLYSQEGARPELGNRVRVLLTGVPLVHGAERVLELIEQSGALVVAMENCTGLKPILEDIDPAASDPLTALAEKYFHLPCSVMTPNHRRLESLRQLAAQFKPDCVIELIWQACLTYDVESHNVRRFAEEQLGLPYLRIETDYSPSDSARISVRVEALLETVRGRRQTSPGVGGEVRCGS